MCHIPASAGDIGDIRQEINAAENWLILGFITQNHKINIWIQTNDFNAFGYS